MIQQDGYYWVKIVNVCPCSYCTKVQPPPIIGIVKMEEGCWKLFGTDMGINKTTHPEEVIVLEKIETKWSLP